jgi:hypothetical protein
VISLDAMHRRKMRMGCYLVREEKQLVSISVSMNLKDAC